MGIKDLAKELRPKGTSLKDIELLQRKYKLKKVGVDTSSWMHIVLSRYGELVNDFHAFPRRTLEPYFREYFTDMKTMFDEYNIQLILVFDGWRNPLKNDENTSRQDKIIIAEQNIASIVANLDPSTETDFIKFRKSALYVRDDILANVVAWARSQKLETVVTEVPLKLIQC